MKGDETLDEHLARQLQNPDFAAAWAVQAPFGNLGLNVWSLRLLTGMTQQQLAQAAQMKQPRIAEMERGDANPTLLTISRVAHALGVTADRLLVEPDEALLAKARAITEAEAATWSPRKRRALGLENEDGAQPPAPILSKPRRKTA